MRAARGSILPLTCRSVSRNFLSDRARCYECGGKVASRVNGTPYCADCIGRLFLKGKPRTGKVVQ